MTIFIKKTIGMSVETEEISVIYQKKTQVEWYNQNNDYSYQQTKYK